MCSSNARAAACAYAPSGSDRDNAVLGLEHVSGTGDDQGRGEVGDRQHGFQPTQHAVGAPILGQFDRSTLQLPLMLVELRLKPLE